MPEDLPEAVKVLLWLLIGVIVFGYLLMAHTIMISFIFAAVYFSVPVIWRLTRKRDKTP